MANAFFRALPGEAASPAGLQSSSGGVASPLAAPGALSAIAPSGVPFGQQPPVNVAPGGSPLASPSGTSPNVPGVPFPQGQVPGANFTPSSHAQVLSLGNRAGVVVPHAQAANGVPDKAFSTLPAYEPKLAGLATGVPQAHAATGAAAAQHPAGGAAPFYFASDAANKPRLGTSTDKRPGDSHDLDTLSRQALAALNGQDHAVPLAESRQPGAGHALPVAAGAGERTSQYYFVDAVTLPSGYVTPAKAHPHGGHAVPQADRGRHPAFDVHAVRRDFPILQERINGKQLVWLDNAATTHKPRQVIERIAYFYEHENSNIHRAAHELAARATDAYEHAREVARRFINAPDVHEIIFVRGTTEAINLIAKAWGGQHVQEGDEIIVSNLEHHANIVPWQQLAQAKGAKLRVIPVDDQGQVLLDEYRKLINDRTKVVSVAHVSNVLGTVVPVKEIVDIAKCHGITTVIDGAQSIAHTPVDVQDIGADFFVFSGHKIFGPTGIGVLWGKRDVLENMPPWQGGGNMIADVTFEKTVFQPLPNTFEAGTGNIADAVGLGAALEYVERLGIHNISHYEHALVDYGMAQLAAIAGVRLIGTVPGKASVLSFVLDGYSTDEVGQILNAEGIAVRTGHHCAQPILRRFGVETAVRPSLAFYNTFDEIDQLVQIIQRLAGQRRH
ncbi:SufS family cysteine desulfurase [Lampropedia puyangensis]|uniref:cysteine desulfurase n=1 Tax=Lampropedia puyangensis TaxID=1330072 RepID=A0A4S8EXV4_9BURK|nr:SufS family cysteine desulfurase [Lampropedia puyangensis]